jgi:dinuclear metal center YbgI/SA1388 family protein
MVTAMPMNGLEQLVAYLDEYLRVAEIPDDPRALNGLQVENSGVVGTILGAVDVSQAAIDAAVARGARMLLVHHGLFWGGLEPVRGRLGRRVRSLVLGDVALYSAHLPLDCHPEVGNNAVLARTLGLTDLAPFGRMDGIDVGISGVFSGDRDELAARLTRHLGVTPRVIGKGPSRLDRVAIVTGAGSDTLAEARDRGIGTLITGEGRHHTFFDAEEWGMNLIYAGHYATETVGVRALGRHLQERFAMTFEFFDHPTGL